MRYCDRNVVIESLGLSPELYRIRVPSLQIRTMCTGPRANAQTLAKRLVDAELERREVAPPPDPRLKRDWVGLHVRSLCDLRNGYLRMPAGCICKVTRYSRGLHLESEPCPTCGAQLRMSRVQERDVEIILWPIDPLNSPDRSAELPVGSLCFVGQGNWMDLVEVVRVDDPDGVQYRWVKLYGTERWSAPVPLSQLRPATRDAMKEELAAERTRQARGISCPERLVRLVAALDALGGDPGG